MRNKFRIREGKDGLGDIFYKVERRNFPFPFWYNAFENPMTKEDFRFSSFKDAESELKKLIKDEQKERYRRRKKKLSRVRFWKTVKYFVTSDGENENGVE